MVKSTVPWRYVIIHLNWLEIRGRPGEKVLQRRVYSLKSNTKKMW